MNVHMRSRKSYEGLMYVQFWSCINFTGVFRTLPNIYDGALTVLAVNCFIKELHHRCLKG